MAKPIETKKFDYIDALRGFAVLGVLLVHASQHGKPLAEIINGVVVQGARGVQLFFVLSALTLCLSMSQRSSKEKHPTRNFFIRRFFRIAPMFYFAAVYYVFLSGFSPESAFNAWFRFTGDGSLIANFLATTTFTGGLNPTWFYGVVSGGWTIQVEMLFYLLLPLIFTRIKSLSGALLGLSMTLTAAYLLIPLLLRHSPILDAHLWDEFISFGIISELPIFMLGVILYFLVTRKVNSTNSRLSIAILYLAVTSLFITRASLNVSVLYTFGLVFSALVYALYLHPYKILVNNVTTYIGRISYSVYIVHFGVIDFMTTHGLIDFTHWSNVSFFIRYIMIVILSVAVSSLTYRLIERPGQSVGKKIISHLERKRDWKRVKPTKVEIASQPAL